MKGRIGLHCQYKLPDPWLLLLQVYLYNWGMKGWMDLHSRFVFVYIMLKITVWICMPIDMVVWICSSFIGVIIRGVKLTFAILFVCIGWVCIYIC